jgi:P27 family predicted phage terminase small subunit
VSRGVREPVGLKILHGRGAGRDGRPRDSGGRAIEPPPNFRRMAPEKPKSLSLKASEHWDEIVPELERLQILTPSHVGGLAILTEVYARIQRARQLLEDKVTAKNSQGEVESPVLRALRQDEKLYLAVAGHFGLTPSSEGQLRRHEEGGDDDNPFE